MSADKHQHSKSKAQQEFMGMVHATQKGTIEAPSEQVQEVAKEIKPVSAKSFASTKHKDLPEHAKHKKHKQKSTFERGFAKRAMDFGLTEEQADDLYTRTFGEVDAQ